MCDETPDDNDANWCCTMDWLTTFQTKCGAAKVKILGDGKVMRITLPGFITKAMFRINQAECGEQPVTRQGGHEYTLQLDRCSSSENQFNLVLRDRLYGHTAAHGRLQP